MDYKPTIHIVSFADRVRALNQLRSPEFRMSATEANNLHADITNMLAEIARLNLLLQNNNQESVQIEMDGGKF